MDAGIYGEIWSLEKIENNFWQKTSSGTTIKLQIVWTRLTWAILKACRLAYRISVNGKRKVRKIKVIKEIEKMEIKSE